MRRKLVVGNWKMNGLKSEAHALLSALREQAHEHGTLDIVVCPPFVYLPLAQECLSDTRIAWGAQDVSDAQLGAYTGQVAAEMLVDLGCQYVIVGHSERRQYCAENDECIVRKCKRALDNQLIPIVCVGETLADREAHQTQTVVGKQVNALLNALSTSELSKLVFAYEPVWAIGTGVAASAADAENVHQFIRQLVAEQATHSLAEQMRIIYGGSVKPDNASELFQKANIDGGLIGGAALQANAFLSICKAAG